jgi:hypothetical protein
VTHFKLNDAEIIPDRSNWLLWVFRRVACSRLKCTMGLSHDEGCRPIWMWNLDKCLWILGLLCRSRCLLLPNLRSRCPQTSSLRWLAGARIAQL